MSNPAYELWDIFYEWREATAAGMTAQDLREWSTDQEAATAKMLKVNSLLSEVRRAIDRLDAEGLNVEAARITLPEWGRMAAHAGLPWSQSVSPEAAFPPAAMGQLQMMGTLIAATAGGLAPGGMAQLREVVAEAIELLEDDDAISDQLRWYLVKLVREIRDAVEDETLAGGFDYTAAAERLWVAMQAAAGQSDDNRASRWRDAASKLIVPAVSGVITHAATLGYDGITAALGQLGH